MADADLLTMPPGIVPDETEDDDLRRRTARLPIPDAMPAASIQPATPQPEALKAIMPSGPIAPVQPPVNANPAPVNRMPAAAANPPTASPSTAMPPSQFSVPGYPNGAPELHGWKRVLDVIGSLHPLGREIEAGIPGTPQNYRSREALANQRFLEAATRSAKEGEGEEKKAQTRNLTSEAEQREEQTRRMKSGQQPIKNPVPIFSGTEQVGEEGYDESGNFHRNMFPAEGAPAPSTAAPAAPALSPAAANTAVQAARETPAGAAPNLTTQRPATPETAAKLKPVGDESNRYNNEIKGVLGKEAGDYVVKPTDSAEKAEKTLGDARARATEILKGQSNERAANAPNEAQERKDERTIGYAVDKDGNLAMMSKADADKLHSTFEEMKPADIKADRQSLRQLNDVQQNVSRYRSAVNAIKGNISSEDSSRMAGILSDKELGAKLEPFGVGLDLGQLNDALTQTRKADYWNKLGGDDPQLKSQLQDAVLSYLRSKSSIIAYNKVLSGSARASEKQLEVEMAQLPAPYVGSTVGNKQLNAFQENIDRASEGFPVNLPGLKSPKQVRAEAEAMPEPQRPDNVPSGYKWNASGPKGPGWYK